MFHSAARVILLKCICAHGTPCLESFNSSIPFLFKSGPNSHSWVKRPFSHLSASALTIFPVSRTSSSPVGHPFILSLVRLVHAPHQPCQHPMHLLAPAGFSSLGLAVPSPGKPSSLVPCLPLLVLPLPSFRVGSPPAGRSAACLMLACL